MLTEHNLHQYFRVADSTNSHYTVPTNCFNFVPAGHDRLIVTIGDSWTYGQDLSDRMHQVFGYHLSQILQSDWLNLGQPGSSNFFIAEKAEELSQISRDLPYQDILVVCTFTEIGRGFDSHHDRDLLYREWMIDNIKSSADFYQFLWWINRHCVDRILLAAASGRFRVYFASNFVQPMALPDDRTITPAWIEFLVPGGLGPNHYAGTTGVQRLLAIEQFLSPHHMIHFKQWIADMIESANTVDKNIWQMRSGTIHPDPQGHTAWAYHVAECLADMI